MDKSAFVNKAYIFQREDPFEYDMVQINRMMISIASHLQIEAWENEQFYDAYCEVWRIFRKAEDDTIWLQVKWFYHPKVPKKLWDIEDKYSSEGELFKSEDSSIINAETVKQVIDIIPYDKYIRSLEDFEPYTFFWRSVYDSQKGTLSPPVDQWERVCYCHERIEPEGNYTICDGCERFFHAQWIQIPNEDEDFYCKDCQGRKQGRKLK